MNRPPTNTNWSALDLRVTCFKDHHLNIILPTTLFDFFINDTHRETLNFLFSF